MSTLWVSGLGLAILGVNLWHAWCVDRRRQKGLSER